MIIVLDTSAAIEIILKKDKANIFNKVIEKAKWIIAPDIFVSEITNVLWKYYKAKIISHEECMQFVKDGLYLIDDFIEAKDLWKESLGEAIKNNYSAYGMFYAVLSRRNDAKILTKE
jgi:predicted nucleic acid-binding protein